MSGTRLATDLKSRKLQEVPRTIPLDALPAAFEDFVKRRVKGRTVVSTAA